MKLPEGELSPEAHRALVECLKIAARRGRELGSERECAVLAHEGTGAEKVQGADAAADSSSETGTPEAGS